MGERRKGRGLGVVGRGGKGRERCRRGDERDGEGGTKRRIGKGYVR